jgi:hypothetical protein
MPPVGIESTILASERQQTYALDRSAIETGIYFNYMLKIVTYKQKL